GTLRPDLGIPISAPHRPRANPQEKTMNQAVPFPGGRAVSALTRVAFALVCSALLLAGGTARAANKEAARPPQVKLEFEKYTPPNGLEVILHEDHQLPLSAVNIWYHTGPANERAGQTGFAHLFEHLMFQASGHVPEDTYFKYLEAAGASFV